MQHALPAVPDEEPPTRRPQGASDRAERAAPGPAIPRADPVLSPPDAALHASVFR